MPAMPAIAMIDAAAAMFDDAACLRAALRVTTRTLRAMLERFRC